MEHDILFDSTEEQEATERVLAFVRIKTLNTELDQLVSDIIKLSSSIDTLLEENNLKARYLERLGVLENLAPVSLDEDLEDINFRIKEIAEDLIKRINTRITLIKNNEVLIKELQETYNVNEDTIVEDIDLAKLRQSDFIEE